MPGTSDAAAPGTSGATRPPAPKEFVAIPQLKDIYFAFDRYDIRSDDTAILDENARWMKANPRYLILIEGHCDERGTNEYNLALGERRAKATMNYLVGQGVPASRITTISYGVERPVCTEKTEACWGKNRRAHFLVKE
jgi:peptidoglycan-associated lipoprotein